MRCAARRNLAASAQTTSMPYPIIRTHDLTHRFSVSSVAVNKINLAVMESSIYGFLGPNGSGKTTTLSLLLGLIPIQEGAVEIFGRDFTANRLAVLRRVGSLIEAPSIYGHLSAHENIEVYRRLYGMNATRTKEVLDMTGIANTGSKAARKFSLGMKQRLAVAIALLPQPKLLVLDEPTNGLDPAGILELRELIRDLNAQHGVTVLVSSHILSEVEKIVSDIGIIRDGSLVFQGTRDTLLRQGKSVLHIRTSDNLRAAELLRDCQHNVTNGTVDVPFVDDREVGRLNRLLLENGIDVYQLDSRISNLEQLFLQLTTTHP